MGHWGAYIQWSYAVVDTYFCPVMEFDNGYTRLHYKRMITSTLTKRSQTTIPRQVRNALHLQPGQSLVYEIEADRVIVRGHPGVLASFGALKGKGKASGVDFSKARQLSRDEWVEEAGKEGVEA